MFNWAHSSWRNGAGTGLAADGCSATHALARASTVVHTILIIVFISSPFHLLDLDVDLVVVVVVVANINGWMGKPVSAESASQRNQNPAVQKEQKKFPSKEAALLFFPSSESPKYLDS